MKLLDSHIRDWREMAAVDPFRAISGRKAPWNSEDMSGFLATAQPHMDLLSTAMAAAGLPARFDRALEFGCGAGRFLPHFKRQFGEVWGVDVSEDMLALAARHSPDCKFRLNVDPDLRFFPDHHFDLIYSFLVLQHLPEEAMILRYIREFIRVLKPGGLAAFQLPCRLSLRWRIQPRRRLYHLLRALGIGPKLLQSWNLLPMMLTAVSKEAVAATVSLAGGRICRQDSIFGDWDIFYYCTK